MFQKICPRRVVSAGAGLCAAAALLPGAAHADVTTVAQVVVSEVVQPSLSGSYPANAVPERRDSAHSPQTVTTYYKGGNVRSETAGGVTVLYNGGEGKIYTLDPAQKTYFVRSVKDTWEPPQPQSVKAGTSIDVKPGSQTRTIDGASAQVYTVSGVVTLSPQRRGGYGGGEGRGGRGGGHHGRGGGFPGGGFPLFQQNGFPGGGPDGDSSDGDNSSRRGGEGGRTRTTEVSGELWLSDAVRLPDDKHASVLPALQDLLPQADAASSGELALKPLADALNKKRDIPLQSRLTVTRTDPRTGAQDSTTTTLQVTSVSRTPLADALFQLPLGYTEVAPPAVPSADLGE